MSCDIGNFLYFFYVNQKTPPQINFVKFNVQRFLRICLNDVKMCQFLQEMYARRQPLHLGVHFFVKISKIVPHFHESPESQHFLVKHGNFRVLYFCEFTTDAFETSQNVLFWHG